MRHNSIDNKICVAKFILISLGVLLLYMGVSSHFNRRPSVADPTIPAASDAAEGLKGYHKKTGPEATNELRKDVAEAIRYEVHTGNHVAYGDITQYADDVRIQLHMELESKGYKIETKTGVLGTFWVISW
jgi:hypothetical protein